jgi:hypothetical protein
VTITGTVTKLLILDAQKRDSDSGAPHAVISISSRDAGLERTTLVLLKGEFELGDTVEVTIKRHRDASGQVLS